MTICNLLHTRFGGVYSRVVLVLLIGMVSHPGRL